MGRKAGGRTKASSAAAAAAGGGSAPAFTSFAAATAHALGTESSDNAAAASASALSEWDADALQVLKKLSKRDATTRARAIDDLAAMVAAAAPPAGHAFVTAWGAAFSAAAAADPHPAVRAAALRLTANIVLAFRKLTQPILGAVVPVWVAAQGDSVAAVAQAARESLASAFQTDAMRAKLAAKYRGELVAFCIDSSAALRERGLEEGFTDAVRKIVAVVVWIVQTMGSIEFVLPFLDAESDPLVKLGTGVMCKRKGSAPLRATREVCEAAVLIVRHMKCDATDSGAVEAQEVAEDRAATREADLARVRRYGELAMAGIEHRDAAGWDLLLTLLRSGWHMAFSSDLVKLKRAVCKAVTAPLPCGLNALLPFFDALPTGNQASSDLAVTVLTSMRDSIHPRPAAPSSDENDTPQRPNASAGYAMHALPAYVECASFVYRTGARRWLGSSNLDEVAELARQMISVHIVPTLSLYISASILPFARLSTTASSRRRVDPREDSNMDTQSSRAFGQALQNLTETEACAAAGTTAGAYVAALQQGATIELVHRYAGFLRALEDGLCAGFLAGSIIQKVISIEAGGDVGLRGLQTVAETVEAVYANDPRRMTLWTLSLREKAQVVTSYALRVTKSQLERVQSDSRQDSALALCIELSGQVLSWSALASSLDTSEPDSLTSDTVLHTLSQFSPGDVRGELMGAMLNARKVSVGRLGGTLQCEPFNGDDINIVVCDAAADFERELQAGTTPNAGNMSFLLAAADPSGGARLSESTTDAVSCAALRAMNLGPEVVSNVTSIISMLLSGDVRTVEIGNRVTELVSAAVTHSDDDERLLASALSFLQQLSPKYRKEQASSILDGIRSTLATCDEAVVLAKAPLFARAWVMVVNALNSEDAGKDSRDNSFSLYEETHDDCGKAPLLPSTFSAHMLCHAELCNVFGGLDSDTPFVPPRFVAMYEKLGEQVADRTARQRMQLFLGQLSATEKAEVTTCAARSLLAGANNMLLELVRHTFITQDGGVDVADDWAATRAIAAVVLGLLKAPDTPGRDHDSATSSLQLAVALIEACVVSTRRQSLEALRATFIEAGNIVRRDPFGDRAQLALSLLTGALKQTDEASSVDEVPAWLCDLVRLMLRTVRRSYETASLAPSSPSALLGSGALLMACAVNVIGAQALPEDEWRFWAIAVQDALSDACRQQNPKNCSSRAKREVACVARLGATMVAEEDARRTPSPIGGDDICRRGCWAAVLFLPIFEESGDATEVLADGFDAGGLAALALMAAERGVLIRTEDETLPVPRDVIYELVPLLGSRRGDVRRAVLVILAHAGAFDLPMVVAGAFPEKGFADEAKEIRAVTNMIPPPIRRSLVWPLDAETKADHHDQNEHDASMAVAELGFFLSWRLFLDLIRAADAVEGRALLGDAREDVSFRRVGISYLRANPGLYCEFFNRCVDVVVDGGSVEQAAAAEGAVDALAVEERAAQGLQLATASDSNDKTSEKKVDDNESMDVQVGRAAGIAFARALQRLPALSRQHVTDSVDHGTSVRIEGFVRKRVSPLLIAAEVRKVKEWGAFGGGRRTGDDPDKETEGELHARGSVAGREVSATYTLSDVTLEIGIRLPDVFPLQPVVVEARSRVGMTEARWRKTLLGMTTLLRAKDGTLAEAVELWRRNLDKTFQGVEECPICYSVLHLVTAARPRMQCRTCKNLFHSECLCKWFSKSNSSACPLCRSAF